MPKTPNDLYLWATTQCAARECCPADIAAKLQRKGATPDEADALVARLTDENYLNEERYARAFASDKFRFDRWGRIKIRYALRMQRIPDSCIDIALNEIPEADYRAALADFITAKERCTKAKTDYERYQKLVRAAMNRGFEPECVRNELQRRANEWDMDEWTD